MACRAPRGSNLPLSTAAAAGVTAEPNNYISIPTTAGTAATGSATGSAACVTGPHHTVCSTSAPNTTTTGVKIIDV